MNISDLFQPKNEKNKCFCMITYNLSSGITDNPLYKSNAATQYEENMYVKESVTWSNDK